MFSLKKTQDEPTPLDKEIDNLFKDLDEGEPATEDYSNAVDQLVKLYKLREESNLRKRVSPDALAAVVGNLAGILLILNFERVHVVTTKALGFVMKSPR